MTINDLILYLKNNINIIILMLFFRIFLRIIGYLKNKYIRKYTERIIVKKDLDKHEILKSLISNLGYKIMYILSDLILLYFSFSMMGSIILVVIVLLLIKDLIDIYPIFNKYYNISNNNYVITEDLLLSKNIINRRRKIKNDTYALTFKDYFEKYNNYVSVDKYIYDILKESDEYYLIFTKNSSNPIIFNKNEYNLSNDLNKKVIDTNELNTFNQGINLNTNYNYSYKIELTKEFIIDNIYGKEKKDSTFKIGILSFILILFSICIHGFLYKLFLVSMILGIVLGICFIFSLLYMYSVINHIKKGEYTILKDEIISIKKNLSGNNKKKITEIRFKNYNMPFVTTSNLSDLNDNDLVYLLILNTKELISVYDLKKYYI